jgi:hypothetical protein
MEVRPSVSEDALEYDVEEQGTEMGLDPKPHHVEDAADANWDESSPRSESRSDPDGEADVVYTSSPAVLNCEQRADHVR